MLTIGILAMARQGHGGTLLYTRSMIEALLRLAPERHALVLYTQADNHEYDAAGVRVERLPSPARIVLTALSGRRLFEAVDVVIAPIYSTVLLASARPFAFTLHDMQERYLPENFSLATRIWRHLTNKLLTARAGRVICESAFVRSDIVRFLGVAADKVAVIPAPPVSELREREPDAAAIERVRAKYGLPPIYLFYPAQFWPHKNHRRLVEAFVRIAADHPQAHLVLTGKKRDEFDRVFERVRELGLGDKVKHIGYVEQEDLGALYGGATLAVIPTLFESISIPVYEAFALGTPVCVSNVVAIPDQVGDAAVLFDPRSVDDIAAKTSLVLGDAGLRATLVERGRTRMAAIDHGHYAQQLLGVIDGLAGRPAPAPQLTRAEP